MHVRQCVRYVCAASVTKLREYQRRWKEMLRRHRDNLRLDRQTYNGTVQYICIIW